MITTPSQSRKRTPFLVGIALIAVVALAALTAPFGVRGADWGDDHSPGRGPHGGPGGAFGGPGECMQVARAAMAMDEVLTELVDEQTLTESQANAVRERMQQRAEAEGGPCGAALSVINDVSDLLGLTPREIHDRFLAGESLSEIAATEGVSRDELIAVFQEAVVTRLDVAAASGRITTEERDALQTLAFSHIERMIDHHIGDHLGPGEEPSTEPASADALDRG